MAISRPKNNHQKKTFIPDVSSIKEGLKDMEEEITGSDRTMKKSKEPDFTGSVNPEKTKNTTGHIEEFLPVKNERKINTDLHHTAGKTSHVKRPLENYFVTNKKKIKYENVLITTDLRDKMKWLATIYKTSIRDINQNLISFFLYDYDETLRKLARKEGKNLYWNAEKPSKNIVFEDDTYMVNRVFFKDFDNRKKDEKLETVTISNEQRDKLKWLTHIFDTSIKDMVHNLIEIFLSDYDDILRNDTAAKGRSIYW